jgi:4'-phosphopantetheinyl transferase
VLAQYLNLKPIEVAYKTVFNNKPGLMGNPVHFNLTHTREAFAFAVSGDYCIGIDLEDINQNMDIYSVAKSSFSEKERDYIFKSEKRARDRFFLLWTRKEALLKAIGTGITDDLTAIEVCDKENIIDPKLFTTFNLDITSAEYYIYSKKISNSYLSVAVSHQIKYNFHHLKEETFVSFINSKF